MAGPVLAALEWTHVKSSLQQAQSVANAKVNSTVLQGPFRELLQRSRGVLPLPCTPALHLDHLPDSTATIYSGQLTLLFIFM